MSVIRVLKLFLVLVLAVIIAALILLVIPILIGVVLYRRFLFHFARYIRPSLGKMVTLRASSHAAEAFHKSTRLGEVVILVLEGNPQPTIQFLRDLFRERVLDLKYPSSQELRYPELRQTIVHFMGYLFWEDIPEFNLEEYLYIHPQYRNQPMSHEEVYRTAEELISKPFPKDKVMWELILIPEYVPKDSNNILNCNYSALIFRQHHSLADGYAKIKFLQQFSLKPVPPLKTFEIPQVGWFVKTLFYISLWIKLPFELAHLTVNNTYSDMWIVSTDHNGKPRKPSEKYVGMNSASFDLSLMKEIKNKHGVSFSAVAITGYLCALESQMTQSRKNGSEDILMVMPFPMGKHPEKLRNHFSFAFLYLPVAEKNLVKRLHIVHKRFEKLKRAALPVVLAGDFGSMVLSIPYIITRFAMDQSVKGHGCVFTNFPAPTSQIDLFGYNLTDIILLGAATSGTNAMFGSLITYGGRGIFGIGSDSIIMPNEEVAEDIVQTFMSTLEQLKSAPLDGIKDIV